MLLRRRGRNKNPFFAKERESSVGDFSEQGSKYCPTRSEFGSGTKKKEEDSRRRFSHISNNAGGETDIARNLIEGCGK